MKRVVFVAFTFIFCLMSMPQSVDAQAVAAANVKAGYVDVQTVLEGFGPYDEAIKELTSYREDLQSKISEDQKSIAQMRKQFEQEREFLGPQKQREKQQEIMGKMQAFQDRARRGEEMMNRKKEELLAPVLDKVEKAVTETGKDLGYNVIYNFGGNEPSSILWVSEDVDITDEVIARLNENESDDSQ